MEVTIKKDGWAGGGFRFVKIVPGIGDDHVLKVSGKTLNVAIGPGLPCATSKTFYCSKRLDVQTIRNWKRSARHLPPSSSFSAEFKNLKHELDFT